MYIRGRNFRGFGQIGSTAEITAAAMANAQLVAQKKLQLTKNLGQDAQFAFDPNVPDIIYAITTYFGNGPGGSTGPYFKSIAPAKFQYAGSPPVPWVGLGPDPRPAAPVISTPTVTTTAPVSTPTPVVTATTNTTPILAPVDPVTTTAPVTTVAPVPDPTITSGPAITTTLPVPDPATPDPTVTTPVATQPITTPVVTSSNNTWLWVGGAIGLLVLLLILKKAFSD